MLQDHTGNEVHIRVRKSALEGRSRHADLLYSILSLYGIIVCIESELFMKYNSDDKAKV